MAESPALPEAFLTRPLAHRALHDRARGRVENSASAVRAAVAAGYGIEIDIQPSADGVAMVFHDYDLDRLTGATGPVNSRTADDLRRTPLTGGDDPILSLAEILTLADDTPLLIELKDPSLCYGPRGAADLAGAVVRALDGHTGPVALMSFNPHVVSAVGRLRPDLPRGVTTGGYNGPSWEALDAATQAAYERLDHVAPTGAAFISHDRRRLADPAVPRIKAGGLPVLTWTIRSAEEEAAARAIADNITFEGYRAALT